MILFIVLDQANLAYHKDMSSPVNTSDKEDKSTLYVALSTLAVGVLMVFYMSVLTRVSESQLKEDPLDRTARLVAQELSGISISYPDFGSVKIKDINELKGSIRSGYLFAEANGHKWPIEIFAKYDLDNLNRIEQELGTLLQKSVEENGSIYALALNSINRSLPAGSKLYSLKISLGAGIQNKEGLSNITAPIQDKNKPFAQEGFYKINFPVPCIDQVIYFHKEYDKLVTFEPEHFVLIAPNAIPSTLMIETVIEQKDNTSAQRRIIKQTCATINSFVQENPSLFFSFRFPDGLPAHMKLSDFLQNSFWQKDSQWQQAINGDVPGRGHLWPVGLPVTANFKPSDALSIALYHWIRQSRSKKNIDPQQLTNLMKKEIPPPPIDNVVKQQVNSCLLRDSAYSGILEPKAEKRKLSSCFEYKENAADFPANAFPLIVDRHGKASIAGRSIYDEKLVQDYLTSLYKTNLAALETFEIAKLVAGNTNAQISALKMQMLSREQELKALSVKVGKDQNQIQIQNKIEPISASIKQDRAKLDELLNVFKTAKRAARNAQIAILRTYELGSHNLNYCSQGLHKLDNAPKRFLLSRKDVFYSYENPISDQNIIEGAKGKSIGSEDGGYWLLEKLPVLDSWQNLNAENDTIDRQPVDLVLAEVETIPSLHPVTVLLDGSKMYTSYKNPYVFAGLPISQDQLFYYNQGALEKDKVFWTATVRDYLRKTKSSLKGIGANSPAQFLKAEFNPPLEIKKDHYPRMAGEFQLRRPIVKDLPELSGTVIRDPSWKKESPIIPPPDML